MISKIKLQGIATYKDLVEIETQRINYFFGGNGTGKSTISKLLRGDITCEDSVIEYDNISHERIVGFNRTFINNCIGRPSDLKGIFTLGEESKKYQDQIKEIDNDIEFRNSKKEKSQQTYNNLNEEIQRTNRSIEEMCWSIKSDLATKYPEVIKGYAKSKTKFAERCFTALQVDCDVESLTEEKIGSEYRSIFSSDREAIEPLPAFDTHLLQKLADSTLIGESIVGNSNSQISALILKLKAGDWVKQGIEYAHQAEGVCPYCQNKMDIDIQREIEAFFDETYKEKCNNLEKYRSVYIEFKDQVYNYEQRIPQSNEIINYSCLSDEVQTLRTIVERNIDIIERKIAAPSQSHILSPIDEYISDIKKTISDINDQIQARNSSLSDEKAIEKCKLKILNYYLSTIRSIILSNKKTISDKQKGLNGVSEQIKKLEDAIEQLKSDKANIEAKISSVKPVVGKINRLLKSFGFESFELEENEKKPGTYKIVRPDDRSAVKDTLSEGEANFIAFLYFYYLCYGSFEQDNITEDKIIVIDDPISSMDSNVLYIVSSLTKDLLVKCREGQNGIRQMFILTHNSYFFKEITYWGSREKLPTNVGAYFVIKKSNNQSQITTYEKPPIKSTYELLWDDIKCASEPGSLISVSTACNTMRRILEHYFNVIGKVNYEKCIDSLEGQDRLIGKALISLINDGSHSIFDDYSIQMTEESIHSYLRVFQMIFEKNSQIEHYNMMMGLTPEITNEQVAVEEE